MEISDKIQILKQKQDRYLTEISTKDKTLLSLQALNKEKTNKINTLQAEKSQIKSNLDESISNLTDLHKKDLEAANLQWQG